MPSDMNCNFWLSFKALGVLFFGYKCTLVYWPKHRVQMFGQSLLTKCLGSCSYHQLMLWLSTGWWWYWPVLLIFSSLNGNADNGCLFFDVLCYISWDTGHLFMYGKIILSSINYWLLELLLISLLLLFLVLCTLKGIIIFFFPSVKSYQEQCTLLRVMKVKDIEYLARLALQQRQYYGYLSSVRIQSLPV